ncbi:uncharacterized protein SAPINGB_P004519 [Magnusiomyces paraingens]|uniref:dTMP kinase n=1 Tax=Magnusiomyces paraingens TaxID=2606893 RepID=A0A5E8BV48_9ASCO|nr:uncharacterized protein SAPINGB_P004519 [Saprochaete ingens]VVT55283.1 unnamed protein product [Saprochaete ingens]
MMTSNTETLSRGLLILVEGIDRSGKSTQAQILAESLPSLLSAHTTENFKASVARFPDRTTAIGSVINTYLASPTASGNSIAGLRAAHNLFSANRWEAEPSLRSRIAAGEHLVLDRYVYSGIAYSYAASRVYSQENESKDIEPWLWAPDSGLPVPDMVIFLTLDPEEASRRGGYGEERYEKREIQARVRETYSSVIKPSHESNYDKTVSPWIEIDVSGLNVKQVQERIANEVVAAVEHRLVAGTITSKLPVFDKIIV